MRATARTRRERREEDAIALIAGVFGALWRLRLELGLVASVVVAHVLMAAWTGGLIAVVIVVALVAGGLALPVLRAWFLVSNFQPVSTSGTARHDVEVVDLVVDIEDDE